MSLKSLTLALSLALWGGVLVGPALAQDVRWLDLPRLRFELSVEEPPAEEPHAEDLPAPPPPPPLPLFTAETMARDASPLMVQFANERTLGNARLVYDFHERKIQAIREMTLLLGQVAKERKR